MDQRIQMIDETAAYLRRRVAEMPTVAIVLGSGLGKVAEQMRDAVAIPYRDIPHFVASTATGHKGNLIFGRLGQRQVMAMQGRFHYYEGYSMEEVTFPARVMARLGVRQFFVSNAAGGINPAFRVGDLMLLTDHISFMPNPLIGKNLEEMGPRFPDMTEVYSPRLRALALLQAAAMGVPLRQGVYVAETGPTYETPAEYRMYRQLGGDAVGMSTVPEVIVARHCGMEIFGMSVITNCSKDLGGGVVNDGADVVKAADRAADVMTELFSRVINCM